MLAGHKSCGKKKKPQTKGDWEWWTKGDWEWWREGLQLNRAVRSRWASVRSETRAKT